MNAVIFIVLRMTRCLNILITKQSIVKSLNNHPIRGSIVSVSDSLKKWNIENKIIYLTPDLLKNLKYFPLPFITFIRKKTGEELVLIEKLLEQTFFYYNPIENKKRKISIQDFKKNHAGVALVITDTTNAGQEDYFVILFKNYLISLIKLSGVIFLFFIVGLRIYELRLDIYYMAIFLLKLLGGGVCALLILREYKLDKEFVNRVCKDGKSDCGNVLDSAQFSFLGIVKWSDLGFIYFLEVLWAFLSQAGIRIPSYFI